MRTTAKTGFFYSIKRAFTVKIVQTLTAVFLLLLGLLLLFPLYYAFLSSISTLGEFNASKFIPLPHNPFGEFITNYKALFALSSLFRAVLVTLLRIVFSFTAAAITSVFGGYVFARLNFPGRDKVFLVLLATTMIPGTALTVSTYLWFADFPLFGGNNLLGQGGRGLIDNPAFFFVTGWVNVINIFLFRQAFIGLGGELGESAKIDGANFMYIVLFIYMPLAAPLLVVLGLGTFIGIWNDYMSNLIFVESNTRWYGIAYYAVGLSNYFSSHAGGYDYPKAFAILLMMMAPPTILFCFFQNKFLEGMTTGAIKF